MSPQHLHRYVAEFAAVTTCAAPTPSSSYDLWRAGCSGSGSYRDVIAPNGRPSGAREMKAASSSSVLVNHYRGRQPRLTGALAVG